MGKGITTGQYQALNNKDTITILSLVSSCFFNLYCVHVLNRHLNYCLDGLRGRRDYRASIEHKYLKSLERVTKHELILGVKQLGDYLKHQ
jgi:hypothetical protein